MTITCKYSCKACGLNRVALEVSARQLQSVTVWMEETAQCISADHRRRSPHCHAPTMTELLIPMTGTDRVGGPVKN